LKIMASDYLLPCTCGRTHRVSSSQAGSAIACPCGAKLEVPTMRELKKLEPAAAGAPSRQRTWGLPQGLLFLGMVLVGLGVLAGSYFSLIVMPAPGESDVAPEQLAKMPPDLAIAYWNSLQQGMPTYVPADIAELMREKYVAERGVQGSLMAIALGGAISAAGIVARRFKARLS
jgi:hypothetical protein